MKTRRNFTFLVILVLCLSTFNAAQAISPDAVLDLFDVRVNRAEKRWKIDIIDRKAEGTVNGHDYIMYVNAINGKVTEIVFRGWFDDFVRVLQIPDQCIMTEIMGSREINTYNIYTAQLAEKIPASVWFNSFEEVAQYAVEKAKPGDLVITLGCGDIYKAAKIMIKMLKERYGK